MLQISHHNTETNTCTRINIDTDILDNSPWKNPMWENWCSKGGFYYSAILQYNRVPNWLTHTKKNSPALLLVPMSAWLTSAWLPNTLRQHWASLRHPHRPSSDCAVPSCLSCLSVGLQCLIPSLSFILATS